MGQAPWFDDLDPFDAVCHIASRLDSLLAGVEDEKTLKQCRDAAAVWMRDLHSIRERRSANSQPTSTPQPPEGR